MPKARCWKGGSYNSAALRGGSYNSAALRGGSYNSAALRGGSYNSAALRGGSYNSAALRGGSYNSAALRGGSYDLAKMGFIKPPLANMTYEKAKRAGDRYRLMGIAKRLNFPLDKYDLNNDAVVHRLLVKLGVEPPPESPSKPLALRKILDPGTGIIRVAPVRRGVKPILPSVFNFPPGHPSLPEQFKPIVKAPQFRPAPLKYMLDNGLTPTDLANE